MKKTIFILALGAISFTNSFGQNVMDTFGLKEEIKEVYPNQVEKSYYDTQNRLVKLMNEDASGELVANQLGIAVYEYKYDSKGNRVEQRFYDKDLALYTPKIAGPSMIQYKYDDQNNKVETAYFGTDGDLLGTDVSVVQTQYDNQGRVIEETFLNESRQYLENRATRVVYVYDEKDRLVEEKYFGKNDELSMRLGDGSENDFAIKKYKYNSKNRITEKSYYNKNNQPVTDTYYKIEYKYSEGGKLEEKVKYDHTEKVVDKVYTRGKNF